MRGSAAAGPGRGAATGPLEGGRVATRRGGEVGLGLGLSGHPLSLAGL